MSSIKNKLHGIIADVREAKVAAQSHNVGSYHAPPASNMHSEQHFPPPPPRSLPHGWTARFDEKEGKFAYCMGVDGVEQWEFLGRSGGGQGWGSGGWERGPDMLHGRCAGDRGRWDCWNRGWHRSDR
ncbi:unnamed protein product [Tuber melanosporum]|uniref:(Perigord truffle) hypothetical protein n=1 Tax=Tuber melanosporum (strain Mel28) TaxID=656061 RepID=D5GIT6_TUBMM|nr:uncharacterized protein GSTUM_00008668001 [Tuber melanosporum]CAZ84429.1 unnamed protein product [Tuber melanosporum]